MPRTIQSRLTLNFTLLLAVLLIVTLSITGWLAYRMVNHLRPQLFEAFEEAQTLNEERALLNSARYLSNRLFPYLYDTPDFSSLNEEIDQIRRWLPIRSFLVADAEGRIVTDGSDANLRYGEWLALPDELRPGQPLLHSVPGGSELLFAIGFGDVVAGYAMVALSDEALQTSLRTLDAKVTALWRRSSQALLLAAGLTLTTVAFVAIYLIWRLSRSLTRPISEMIEAADAYATGNLDLALPVRSQDELGRLALSLNTMAQELKKSGRQMLHLANYDSLTGLPNRNLFHDRLSHALAVADRAGSSLGLLFLDLDGFKAINDALGHGVGDEVLKTVATWLHESVRHTDTVARLGGDEFTIVAEGLRTWRDADTLAAKLLETLAQPYPIRDRTLYLSASIGITLYPRDGSSVETLLRNADTAMYLAKGQGKNTYRFFTPELDRRANQRLTLENSLRQAIERREFELHYQPQVHALTGALVGAEALLRWRGPEGLVPPDRFVPVLEDTGMITKLTAWILTEACWTVARWQANSLPGLRIAVNLSALQLEQADLLPTIRQILEETDIAPEALEIEITESTLLNAERGREVADQLQGLGVRLAIDDFGTGYSSLVYLHRYSVETLKIDRSFVREVVTDRDSALITAAVIALARQLGIETVAEGVETPEQWRALREQGCDMVQGYWISRPLSPAQFPGWARQHTNAVETLLDRAGAEPAPRSLV